jgi:photosystem II stability/assembly factor-like uncharacterized protein
MVLPALSSRLSSVRLLFILTCALLAVGVFVILNGGSSAKTAELSTVGSAAPINRESIASAYAKLPLHFEANAGQTDERVRFTANGNGYQLFLTGNEAVLALRQAVSKGNEQKAGYQVVRMSLLGANENAQTAGVDMQPGKMNYFLGNDRNQWRTDVPLYAKVRYQEIYKGIDLIYYGNQRELEYDFEVSPGSDPRAIKLKFEGADEVKLNKETGSLIIAVNGSEVQLKKPVIYQTTNNGSRKEIKSGYRVNGNSVQFIVGKFDEDKPLIIDPILSYSTFLNGATSEIARGIAVDSSGNAYITGSAGSLLFPGGSQFIPPFTTGHAFITKLNPTGSALVYSALIGGSQNDSGAAIALDSSGSAYITGRTDSLNFPTVNAIRSNDTNLLKSTDSGSNWAASNSGLGQSPVSKVFVDPTSAATAYAIAGNALYKTNNGGTSWSQLNTGGNILAFAINPQSPNILYAGTSGTPLPSVIKSTDGGSNWSPANTGLGSGFVSGLGIDPQNPNTLYAGTSFTVFKTTDGGTSWTAANNGITFGNVHSFVFDGSNPGTVYAVAGGSGGIFKTTNGGTLWVRSNNGMTDTVVNGVVIDPSSTSTLYVVTDSAGVFKTTNGAANWTAVNNGVTRLTGRSIAIDPSSPNTLYVGTEGSRIFKTTDGGGLWTLLRAGLTGSSVRAVAVAPSSPATLFAGYDLNATGSAQNGSEAFVTKLNAAGNALVFSTYLGGSTNDEGAGIAIDGSGNILVTGITTSTDFQLQNPKQATLQGSQDGFVTRFASSGTSLVYSTYLGGNSTEIARAIATDSTGNAYVTGETNSTNFPTTPGSFQANGAASQFSPDAFVTKIDPTGQTFAYSTYLGGVDRDGGYAIAVDVTGNAFVAGYTASSNFPLANAVQPNFGGGAFSGDAFVTKLNSTGAGVLYSTYLGGFGDERAQGIAVDANGNAYVAGVTASNNFPVVAGAFKTLSPIYKSTNRGATWNNNNLGVPPARDLVLNPNSFVLYVATVRGVYKSTDSGNNWSPVNNGLTNLQTEVLALDQQNPSTMYVGNGTQGSIFKSTDAGNSWAPANGNQNFTSVMAIATDPVTPNTVYLSTQFSGCYKTINGGTIWTQLGGQTTLSVSSIAINPQNNQIVYASRNTSPGAVLKSIDGGSSWTSISVGSNDPSVGRVEIDRNNPSILYAASSAGLFKSTDAGATWTRKIIESLNFGNSVTIDPTDSSTVYATTDFSSSPTTAVIFKSVDFGEHWQPLATGQIKDARRLVVNPANHDELYAIGNTSASDQDPFLTKINASGLSLDYSTYLGGPFSTTSTAADDSASGVAVDQAGNAYVTGQGAVGFPTTPDAYRISNTPSSGFVLKVTQGFSISGTITNGASVPQSGVKVTLSGARNETVITGVDGTFQFVNLVPGASYTVSSTRSGFSFTPPSQSFTNINANQVANFTLSPSATPFHTISGQIVVLDAITPLAGVQVALTGSQTEFTTTDSNGNYSFSAPAGGNYTVTPTLLGFNFVPPSNNVINLSTNTTLNFSALRVDFVVTNTNDHGTGSLRQAMLDANATQGADRIIFNIPGSGVRTIALTSALPTITDPVIIDGSTQPGYSGSPIVELNGGSAVSGIVITSGNSTLRALVINRMTVAGITLQTNGNNKLEGNIIGLDPSGSVKLQNLGPNIFINTGSTGNIIGGSTASTRNVISGSFAEGISINAADTVVRGNYIGTNSAGTAALGNSKGIGWLSFTATAGNTQVVGNVISGNAATGLDVTAPNTIIQGNLIGTNAAGTAKMPNSIGISVNFNARNSTIGGTTPGERNLISGNGLGVQLNLESDGALTFKGNYIGTDITGTLSLGNSDGVTSNGTAIIGGTESGAGNLISGNDQFGLTLNGGSALTKVQGNLIGTDATGQKALGNATGISVPGNLFTIGGAQAGARNVISGNQVGISLSNSTGTIIQGNYIGVTADGTGPLANSAGAVVLGGASQTQVGGDLPGEGNTIAFNGSGLSISSFNSTNNRIHGNSFFSNSGLGIDINHDGIVNPNDTDDVDTGGNNLQNFPIISSITSSGGSTNIKGSLNSTASTQFRIDFYSNAACDPSGNGEGALPFGNILVTTGANGNATFDVTIATPLPVNRTITATATDPNGNTSEFSACNATNTRGSLEFIARDITVLEDVGSAVVRVVRTGGNKGSLSVNYTTSGGTATAGTDYTTVSGTLVFAEGETEKIILLPIANDGVTEPEETVELTLSGTPDLEALGGKYQTNVHILDAGTQLTLIVDGQAFIGLTEGNVGTSTTNISLHLSAQTSQTVSVDYSITAGTATANVDFVPTSGSLTFTPGTDTQNIPVQLIGDTLDENNETFFLTLSNAVNALNPPAVLVPIIDDDPLPQIVVSDVAVVEGPNAKAVFSVALNVPSGRTVQVSFVTANGTATAGADYTPTSGTLFFAIGETLKQVEVPILTDGSAEPDETFFLNLTNPLRGTIADAQGVGTIVDASSSTSVFQFGAPSYTANESDGQVQITVTRSGGTTGVATVDYQTVSGTANDRTDYTTAVGTLRFDPGVTSQSINVLLTDDTFAEPTESANVVLSNPIGALLGGPTTVPLNLISNDIIDTGSPVREGSFNTAFFVRQHYHDFLNREPDAGGLAFWMNEIDSCSTAECREVKKINVSAAFFLSIEFQETGYLAYRTYRAAYGQTTSPNVAVPVPIIRFNEFLPDSQRIGLGVQVGIGNWEQQLENNKVAYFQEFVQRQRFITAFPLALTPAQFVDGLNQNSGGVLSQSERDQLVAELTSAPTVTQGRASVLRKVADDADMKNNESSRAFVLMQYYGYMRRNPDDPQDTDFRGWEFWLNKLNQFNGNFVDAEMVKAFITSGEYSDRFGR